MIGRSRQVIVWGNVGTLHRLAILPWWWSNVSALCRWGLCILYGIFQCLSGKLIFGCRTVTNSLDLACPRCSVLIAPCMLVLYVESASHLLDWHHWAAMNVYKLCYAGSFEGSHPGQSITSYFE